MARPRGLAVIALLAALGACGKVGPPDTPPGSIYPKAYPSGSQATNLISPLSNRDSNANAASTKITPPPDVNGPTFTAKGSWIDPNTRQPSINPDADLDKWHLNNPIGY